MTQKNSNHLRQLEIVFPSQVLTGSKTWQAANRERFNQQNKKLELAQKASAKFVAYKKQVWRGEKTKPSQVETEKTLGKFGAVSGNIVQTYTIFSERDLVTRSDWVVCL